jgi:hypothetical protein
MEIINSELKGAGWSSSDLIRLSKRIPTAAADYTDAANLEAASLVEDLGELFISTPNLDLCEFISEAENKVLPSLGGPYRDSIYFAAICVLVFHEKI